MAVLSERHELATTAKPSAPARLFARPLAMIEASVLRHKVPENNFQFLLPRTLIFS